MSKSTDEHTSFDNTGYNINYNADLQNYFACTTHETAYRSLLDGIHMHEGCAVLSGAAGAGKTMLLRKLVREASSSALNLVYCPTGTLDFDQLLAFVCDELGLNMQAPDRSDSLAVFKQYLIACYDADTVFVMIVDDAHMLREEVIDQLLALSRSGTVRRGLRLVFCGSPVLLDRLGGWRIRYPALASTFLVHLPRMSEAETTAFITCRLKADALSLPFSGPAVESIVHHADGLPGSVDALCERVLALADRRGDIAISDETVSQAAAELAKIAEPAELKQPAPVPTSPAEAPAAAAFNPDQTHIRFRETGRIVSLPPTTLVLLIALLAPVAAGGWFYWYSDEDISDVSAEAPGSPAAPVASLSVASIADTVADPEQATVTMTAGPAKSEMVQQTARSQQLEQVPEQVAEQIDIAFTEPADEAGPEADLQFWGRIKDSQDPTLYQDYLNAFPQGQFTKLAEFRLNRSTEPPTDELDAIIAKAQVALENDALTTPAENSAVKWAEAALQLDPENEAAHDVLRTVIDTYLEWSLQNFKRQRFGSASTYLQRVQSLEDYASAEQLAAIEVLDKQVSSEQDRAARLQAKRATRLQAKRARSTGNSRNRSFVTGAEAWFNQLDRDFQNLGQKIRREASTFGQHTAVSREQGYNSAR